MDVCEGAAARPLLPDTRSASGLAQHPALGNEDNMAVREFLLQFTSKPRRVSIEIDLDTQLRVFIARGTHLC